jgi:hypothetical protein
MAACRCYSHLDEELVLDENMVVDEEIAVDGEGNSCG